MTDDIFQKAEDDRVAASQIDGAQGEIERRPRVVIRDAAYALMPRPPIESVIDKWISRGSVFTWVGKYGSKKTWAAIHLAVCVAMGKPFIGQETTGGPVLIIDEESGDDRLSRRIGNAIRGQLGDEKVPLYFISLAHINLLAHERDEELIIDLIVKTRAVLVVIDALADIMAGGDENSVRDIQPVFMVLRSIAEKTKAAILLIHHTGKSGDFRGSTAIPGAIDDMILIESEPKSAYIAFKSIKKRDGEPFESLARAIWTEDQFYLEATDLPVRHEHLGSSQQFVMSQFEKRANLTIEIALEAAGDLYTEASIRKAFQILAEKKLIVRTDSGGRGSKAIFAKKLS